MKINYILLDENGLYKLFCKREQRAVNPYSKQMVRFNKTLENIMALIRWFSLNENNYARIECLALNNQRYGRGGGFPVTNLYG